MVEYQSVERNAVMKNKTVEGVRIVRINKTVAVFVALMLAAALLSACDGAAGDAGGISGTAGQGGQKNGGGTSSVEITKDAEDALAAAAADDSAATDETADGTAVEDGTADAPVSHSFEAASADPDDLLVVGDKMFVGQMNDIYLNPDDYLGRTIRYEGFFTWFDNEETGQRYYCLVRNGPGCCGYDSLVGFEVDWSGEQPENDDWCEVEGAIDTYQEDGLDYIVIRAASLEVLPYRGLDTVAQ
jgi:predicted small secreted protein